MVVKKLHKSPISPDCFCFSLLTGVMCDLRDTYIGITLLTWYSQDSFRIFLLFHMQNSYFTCRTYCYNFVILFFLDSSKVVRNICNILLFFVNMCLGFALFQCQEFSFTTRSKNARTKTCLLAVMYIYKEALKKKQVLKKKKKKKKKKEKKKK